MKAGGLIKSVVGSVSSYLGPAPAPLPSLTDDDVNEPPLRSYTDDYKPVAESDGTHRGRLKWSLALAIILSGFACMFLGIGLIIWLSSRGSVL